MAKLDDKQPQNITHFVSHRLPKRSPFYFAVALMLSVSVVSCGGCGDDGESYETVETTEFTKGVRTTIQETSAGKFEIIDEQVVPDTTQSAFVIKYLNGKTDSMSLSTARSILANRPADQQIAQGVAPQSSLSNVLWWGAGGYLLGRMLSSPSHNGFYSPRYYSSPPPQYGGQQPMYGQQQPYRRDSARNRNSRSRSNYRSSTTSGGVFRSATSVSDQLRSTSQTRTISRPVSSGRSGFFRSSSRGSSSS